MSGNLMADRVLPSRDSFKRRGVRHSLIDAKPILAAYIRGDLKTEAEWCEDIDHERVEEILDELCRDWYDMVIREGKTFDFGAAIRALDAAYGEPG